MKFNLQSLMDNLQFRFIVIGGFNTLVGYLVSLGIYTSLEQVLHISLIAIINAVVTISISFTTQRVFVFRSTAPWFPEYIKMYLVNAVSMGANIVLIWVCVDYFAFKFWISQAIITFLLTIYMYFAHKYFTFKR